MPACQAGWTVLQWGTVDSQGGGVGADLPSMHDHAACDGEGDGRGTGRILPMPGKPPSHARAVLTHSPFTMLLPKLLLVVILHSLPLCLLMPPASTPQPLNWFFSFHSGNPHPTYFTVFSLPSPVPIFSYMVGGHYTCYSILFYSGVLRHGLDRKPCGPDICGHMPPKQDICAFGQHFVAFTHGHGQATLWWLAFLRSCDYNFLRFGCSHFLAWAGRQTRLETTYSSLPLWPL